MQRRITASSPAELVHQTAQGVLRSFAAYLDEAERQALADADDHADLECGLWHESRAETLREIATAARTQSHNIHINDRTPTPRRWRHAVSFFTLVATVFVAAALMLAAVAAATWLITQIGGTT